MYPVFPHGETEQYALPSWYDSTQGNSWQTTPASGIYAQTQNNPCCQSCHTTELIALVHEEDEAVDTETDTDDMEDDPELAQWMKEAQEHEDQSMESQLQDYIYHTYVVFKKRWRRTTGRPTRRRRFVKRRDKGKGKGNRREPSYAGRAHHGFITMETIRK